MKFFTGQGDDGTTQAHKYDQPMSKASTLAEAIGSLDELIAFLGVCKVKARSRDVIAFEGGETIATIIDRLQQHLDTVLAELDGEAAELDASKLGALETVIDSVAYTLSEVTDEPVRGGDGLAAHLSFGRAIARRAERRVVEANHAADGELVSKGALAFMNRLSSFLQVLSLRVNFAAGFGESPSSYE